MKSKKGMIRVVSVLAVLTMLIGGAPAAASSWSDGFALFSSDSYDDSKEEQRERELERLEREREIEEERRDRAEDLAEDAADLYEEGMEALDEYEFSDAVDYFSDAAAMKLGRADGALYWKAYALHKSGHRSEALETLTELKSAYPKSRWLSDASALELEIRNSSGQSVSPEDMDDEELKLIALNSLMHSEPSRAIPTLKKILSGTYSPRLKERTLFVLSQSSAPEASQLLGDVARGQGNPDLQLKAIKYLGIMGSGQNGKILADIYQSRVSNDVKIHILRSFMISGDRTRLYQLAKTEPDPRLREEAIRQLGVSGGTEELMELYRVEKNKDVKDRIIKSLMVGGSVKYLTEIARTESDRDLRVRAIKQVGVAGGGGSTLVSIYNGTEDEEIKDAVLSGLFIQGNAKAMIELAEAEEDPDLKRSILKKLSIMGSKEATEYLMKILEK